MYIFCYLLVERQKFVLTRHLVEIFNSQLFLSARRKVSYSWHLRISVDQDNFLKKEKKQKRAIVSSGISYGRELFEFTHVNISMIEEVGMGDRFRSESRLKVNLNLYKKF